MTPIEITEKYMEILYSTGRLENLKELLSDEFYFKGPFYEFNSADDYVESLMSDPAVNFSYSDEKFYTNKNSVCLIYKFFKPGVTTHMAQEFEVINGKITKILLIFDSGVFKS